MITINQNILITKVFLYTNKKNENEFLIANALLTPSYISFETALAYYGLIPEEVRNITSASYDIRKQKIYSYNNKIYKYNDIPKEAFVVGYILINIKYFLFLYLWDFISFIIFVPSLAVVIPKLEGLTNEAVKIEMAMERIKEYDGQYHVLHGVISPMDGIGPDDINLKSLLERLHGDTVKEVIIATNPNIQGEATAMYISRLLQPAGIKVTRLAFGLPVGGILEYADEITLFRAIENRNEI